jgi:non-specific serine/threonine protein kinase
VALALGTRLGPYEVGSLIGAGGMGEVYRARDTKLDRPVAVKVLSTAAAADAERLRRFRDEARAASSLNHPNILVIHDFGEIEGRPFIVTELVEGETIRQKLQAGPLGDDEAVAIVTQVARALSAAHALGIVHRDVKPENVMVRPDGYVKLLDFGVAKLSDATIEADAETALGTMPGTILGTPRYMSPEQIRGVGIDRRSDIWSVGVMLYEMLDGQPPFVGHTAAEIASVILTSEPSLEHFMSSERKGFGRVLFRALRKSALERYSDALELIADLATVHQPAVGLARTTAPAASSTGSNLPLPLTPFIGRGDDLAALRSALVNARFVTLTGAGGVGKTRLALRVASDCLLDFRDGVWLVDLAPLSDGEHVPSALAEVLRVRDRSTRPIADVLCGTLREQSMLILLDNCEHLIEACAGLAQQLLSTCAGVKILATSREPLGVPGETTWRVRSLAVPMADADEIDVLLHVESVELFVLCAHAVRPGFSITRENASAVATICRRLDGLPLAIELAAARLRSMSAVEIVTRLDDRFRLLTGSTRTTLPRQRTLEAMVSWSYELLTEPEQVLFNQLSVFAGGWTLEAAEQVCQVDHALNSDVADIIARLVGRSLIVADETDNGRMRYRLLETLRQFGRDRLAAHGDADNVRARHLSWAVAIAERMPRQNTTVHPPAIAAEVDNLRAALEWACETRACEAGLRLVSTAGWILSLTERRRVLKQLLPFVDSVPLDIQGRALYEAGSLAFMIGDWHWGIETLDAAADVSAKTGAVKYEALSLAYGSSCYWALDDRQTAWEKASAAVAVARKGRSGEALTRCLILQGWLEMYRDLALAESLITASDAEATVSARVFDMGHCREALAIIHCLKGDFVQAAELLAGAITLFEQIQENCGAHILESAAAWSAMTGRFELGAEFLGGAARIRDETGDQPRPWERLVQDVYLPMISEALAPAMFAEAHRRGGQRPFLEALRFAQSQLRVHSSVAR